jgi:predicted Zn finger-like uncharacterized protein
VQASCPQCAQKIVIDDARVPDRAFSVKCPKCQAVVKFPGKTAGPAATPAAGPGEAPPAEAPPASAGEPLIPVTDEVRTQLMAQLRREMTLVNADAGTAGRALVALPDRSQAGALTVMLSRQGYVVDTIEDWDEAGRLVEQGVYNLVLTTKAVTAGKENVYQRLSRLSSDNRRRLFLTLVGDEWKSGDGLQAFLSAADLVLNTRDASNADALVRSVVQERSRVYQVFTDARARHEASAT